MIEQVNNLNKKSFVNYTGPAEKFAEINILFGYNGRGKTPCKSKEKAYKSYLPEWESDML